MKIYFFHTVSIIFALTGYNFYGYAQTGIIKGKVTGNGNALRSATVSLLNRNILTDHLGEFSLEVNPGNYALTITHAGYNKIEHAVKVEPGKMQILEFIMTPSAQLGEVVVLGSRSTVQRSNLSTTVPVDAFSSGQLAQTGQTSVTQMLNFVAPSVNVSRQTLNEPITLRGLNPDQTLILLNGVRYHNLAWVNNDVIRGHLGRGSVANDINSIPFPAIHKIEILRDGASAQYGSDAIAGVINIVLKESSAKTSVNLHLGQQFKGDGENVSLGINSGLPLNKKGFLNFSGEVRYRNSTFRGGKYEGTVYKLVAPNQPLPLQDSLRNIDNQIIASRNFNRSKVSNAGNAQVRSIGMLVNGAYAIDKKKELFWTGTLNFRTNILEGGYRFPKNVGQVNTALFPDGFKARLQPDALNGSGILGVRGKIKERMRWDLSSSYGNNTIANYVENTNNASQHGLGKHAPTTFYTGTLLYQQLINTINFSQDISEDFDGIKLFNLGFGAEWRFENYRVKEGEEASWKNYDATGKTFGGSQGGLIIAPDNAVNENRNVAAMYVDLETEFNKHLLLDLAGRYEYYSDFGGNLVGKLAARYKFSDQFSLRGSLNNGYRAPSLQQSYFGSISNAGYTISGGTLIPLKTGIFNNSSIVARAFGIRPLEAERSLNLSFGFASTLLKRISLTVDGYWIQIRNRVVLSGRFEKRSNPEVRTILANYPDVDQVQFFTNAINTRTSGLDLVLNGNWKIKKGLLAVILASNFTNTHLFGDIKITDSLKADSLNTNSLFNKEERTKVEKGQPGNKIILSLDYTIGKFGFLIRNTRFGKTVVAFGNSRDELFTPKIITDISINYSLKTWLIITAGANNCFNVYPDSIKNPENTAEGTFVYAQEATPFGSNGGYYFVSMALSF